MRPLIEIVPKVQVNLWRCLWSALNFHNRLDYIYTSKIYRVIIIAERESAERVDTKSRRGMYDIDVYLYSSKRSSESEAEREGVRESTIETAAIGRQFRQAQLHFSRLETMVRFSTKESQCIVARVRG